MTTSSAAPGVRGTAGARPASEDAARWYAVAVHTRSEHGAAGALRGVDGVDDLLLPVRKERRAWSDRVVVHEAPLFPGYVFVHTAMSAERRVALLKVRSVHDVVGRLPGDARIARAVGDDEIAALRILTAAERALDPVERLVAGKHVFVAAGPLRGASGVVEHGPDGQRRLVVQVALLGRGVRTLLRADDVVETDAGAGLASR